LWKQGIEEKLFYPELHGREHLKVLSWLSSLKAGLKPLQLAFENSFFALARRSCPTLPENFLSALNYKSKQESVFAAKSVHDSVKLFEHAFGCKPHSFIAPNYCW